MCYLCSTLAEWLNGQRPEPRPSLGVGISSLPETWKEQNVRRRLAPGKRGPSQKILLARGFRMRSVAAAPGKRPPSLCLWPLLSLLWGFCGMAESQQFSKRTRACAFRRSGLVVWVFRWVSSFPAFPVSMFADLFHQAWLGGLAHEGGPEPSR